MQIPNTRADSAPSLGIARRSWSLISLIGASLKIVASAVRVRLSPFRFFSAQGHFFSASRRSVLGPSFCRFWHSVPINLSMDCSGASRRVSWGSRSAACGPRGGLVEVLSAASLCALLHGLREQLQAEQQSVCR
jgi:hypothetical protein